jgi:hypothetical protein
MRKNLLCCLLFCILFYLNADTEPNILIYGEGTTQVTSEIDKYEKILSGAPIRGSIMITHAAHDKVDSSSFLLGDKPLPVKFVQSIPVSSFSNLLITIYQFELEGMRPGLHTLPAIKVKVGGKEYQAPPLTIPVEA